MRISDWSSDVCSSDLRHSRAERLADEIDGLHRVLGGGAGAGEGGAGQARSSAAIISTAIGHGIRPAMVTRRSPPSTRSSGFAGGKDRNSVVEGKRVSGRVDLVGRIIITKKKVQ